MLHSRRPLIWLGAAVLVAASIGTVRSSSPVEADLSDGVRPVLVPITPCRLADTRPTTAVGEKASPLGPGETITLRATGTSGECTEVPADAVGVSLNITAVEASQRSFLTVWPDGERPLASSLNPAPGQAPTPNAVTTALSADGEFRIFNNNGFVHVIVDVNGYLVSHDHDDRYDTSDEVDSKIADATAGIPGAGTSYTKDESDDRYDTSDEVDSKIADATAGIPGAGTSYTKDESDDRYDTSGEVDSKITDATDGLLASGDAYTKAEADARFYEGDRVVLVPGDGTPTENGAALTAALAAITDATAADPYLVRLGAGTFDVGAAGVAMVDHVSISGASRTATIITSPGQTNTFREDTATVLLADGVTLSDLTVRNTGGAGTAARALLGSGAGFEVHTVDLDVIANGAFVAVGFDGADLSGGFDFDGTLRDVAVDVSPGSAEPTQAGGFGSSGGGGDMDHLEIVDGRVELAVRGIGIGSLGGSSISSELVVRDTTVVMTAGGTGAGTTRYDSAVYDDVSIEISGGTSTNLGFSGGGSGFRPQIIDSTVKVSGSGAIGISYNNGVPFISGSEIEASSIAIRARSISSFGGLAIVENSVLDAPTALSAESDGGTQRFEIGGTLLEANTLLTIVEGAAEARCADVHTDDHEPVAADCTGLAPSALGERTILVPGGGTDLENGQALLDALAAAAVENPSDGDEWVIRLEPGTFQVTTPVTLPGHVRLEGAGIDETMVTCGCIVIRASAPVSVADLTIEGATSGYATDFDDDVRLEHLRIVNTTANGETLRIDGGTAVLLDVVLRTAPATVNSIDTLRTTLDAISMTNVRFDGDNGRWRHLGGNIDVRDSTLHALYLPSGTSTISVIDTTFDTRVSTAVPLFADDAALVDVVFDRVTVLTPSSFAVRIRAGDSFSASHSRFEANPTSGFGVIGTAGTVNLLYSAVSESVTATSATCFATVALDTGAFLPDTCP